MKLEDKNKKKKRDIEEYIVALAMFIMTIIAFANVISRKFLGASWSFTEELTANLFILTSMLGAAIAAKRGAHLGLSLITDLLSEKANKVIVIFIGIITSLFCIVLFKEGLVIVKQEMATGQLSPALGWPEWIFGTFIPIGSIFVLVRSLQYTIKQYKSFDAKADEDEAIEEGE